jgi:hypothetical protein
MSVQIDPLPPVPQHTPPLDGPGKDELTRKTPFSVTWMNWFVQLKTKVDTINGILVNLANVAGTGILAKTGTLTWAVRTLTGTANRISVTDGDGVTGNPTVDISATYVGQTSITTLGTVTTGTWNGSAIGTTYGGTGLTSYTTGDILYASASNVLSKLAIGSTNYVLTVISGVPSWQPVSGGTLDWQTCGFWDEPINGAWGHYSAIPNSASNTVMGINASLLTATGTGGFTSVAATNAYTRQPKFKYTSAAGAGSLAGVVGNTAVACGDGGWFFSFRGGIGDAAAVANGILVIGMRAATAAAPNTDPSSHVNVVYFANDPGEANMSIMHNDGAGTATKIGLGANFPANTRSTDWYEVRFRCLTGSGNVDYYVLNVTSGNTTSGTISTDLPSGSTYLDPCYYRGNRTTALATVIDIGGWNIAYSLDG